MKTPITLRHTLRAGLIAAATAAVLGGGAIAPAFADGWHRDTGRYDHAWRGHDWRDRGRVYTYGYAYPPGYGYSYAPAPMYPAPSLNLGFAIR